MTLHAALRQIVEPYVPDDRLYRELVVQQSVTKLAQAVARALDLIDTESPPPSTSTLWKSALGQPPQVRPGVNCADHLYQGTSILLTRLPKQLTRAFLVAKCPERSVRLDGQTLDAILVDRSRSQTENVDAADQLARIAGAGRAQQALWPWPSRS